MCSDTDAVYAKTIHIDCAKVPAAKIVASPGDPGNGFATQ